MWKNMVDPDRP